MPADAESVVLDASLSLALVLPDESSRDAEKLLRGAARGEIGLLTSPLWPFEVANGLLQATRRKRISAKDRLIAFDFLVGLPVAVAADQPPASDLFRLADEERLSVYDACYLALALEENARIGTADGPLRRAARRRGILWSSAA